MGSRIDDTFPKSGGLSYRLYFSTFKRNYRRKALDRFSQLSHRFRTYAFRVFLDEPRSRLARPTFFHLVLSRMRPERDSADRFHRLDKAFDFFISSVIIIRLVRTFAIVASPTGPIRDGTNASDRYKIWREDRTRNSFRPAR